MTVTASSFKFFLSRDVRNQGIAVVTVANHDSIVGGCGCSFVFGILDGYLPLRWGYWFNFSNVFVELHLEKHKSLNICHDLEISYRTLTCLKRSKCLA